MFCPDGFLNLSVISENHIIFLKKSSQEPNERFRGLSVNRWQSWSKKTKRLKIGNQGGGTFCHVWTG